MRHDTLSLCKWASLSSESKYSFGNILLMQSLQSTIGSFWVVLISFYLALITASQLQYCCFYVASAGLLSWVRVITSVSLFCEMRGKGNESFCFPRSHNSPSEVWTSVITFCSLLQWLSPRWQAPALPWVMPCLWYTITCKQSLISEEQSGDLWSATVASVIWDLGATYAFNHRKQTWG